MNGFKEKPVEVLFDIEKKTNYITDKLMKVDLTVNIFEENDKYPFFMKVTVEGDFIIENNEENINFEPNAVAIIYPYIRSIVSTYTANANIMALTLPVINVNKLLKEQKGEEN